ncbi:hypothetical protein J1TS5_47340 [Paenibacillus macerans]|nr:hypothetical protein J1TS5_47340 [Paenibacillus macerans]
MKAITLKSQTGSGLKSKPPEGSILLLKRGVLYHHEEPYKRNVSFAAGDASLA